MLKKINILSIVSNHLGTLKNDNTGKLGWDDLLTFIVLPVFLTSILLYFKIHLTDSAITIIITTLSILVGLLFNVIVIIFDIIKRDGTQRLKNKILNELLTNISFSIILSIIIILFTLATYFKNECICLTATGLVYFFITIYFLTVLMIIKRMYLLFMNELSEIEKNSTIK